MNLHYPLGYPIKTLGSITYFLKLIGVLHNHTNTYKETNTLIKVFNNQIPCVYTIGKVLLILKTTQYTCNTTHRLFILEIHWVP